MSIKFVSKNSNFMVVLKPGVPGSTITGQQPQPGLYVKFQAGVVDVREEMVIDLLRKHKSFGIDFLEVKQSESEVDPYEHTRQEVEPIHNTTEIVYGHVGKKTSSKGKTVLSPELKKIIEAEAVKMLPNLLKKNPKILKDILSGLAEEVKKGEIEEKEEETKRGQGRPAKDPEEKEKEE